MDSYSFINSNLWKKNNGLLDAIKSVQSVINKANRGIQIYADNLSDDIYADPEIFGLIETKLKNKIEINVYYNKCDSSMQKIIQYLETKYANFKHYKINKDDALDVNFLISDDKYIRIEFNKEEYRARYIDTDENTNEAKQWIDSLQDRLKFLVS